ncbi:hypothetical protein BGZ95_002554, partial [Linnemannia exigua]
MARQSFVLRPHSDQDALSRTHPFRNEQVLTMGTRSASLAKLAVLQWQREPIDTMKDIYKEEILAIPEGVKVEVKARQVTVTGPRGTLSKNF